MGNNNWLPTLIPIFGCLMFLFVGSVFLLVFGSIIYTLLTKKPGKSRLRQLAAWAYQQGFTYNPEKEIHFRESSPATKLLPEGDDENYAINAMRGTQNGRKVTCFDYHYISESTDKDGKTSSTTWKISGIIIEVDFPLHKLSIQPENFLDRIGAFFGIDDIDFESAEFSRRFYIKSDNRKWAYDVIHPKVMEYMLARPRYKVYLIDRYILIRHSQEWNPNGFEQALRYIQGFIDLIPADVIAEQKEKYGA